MTEVKYPHITVRLTGQDGNVYAIIGRVKQALKRDPEAGPDAALEFAKEAMSQDSYGAVLQLCMRTVDVT